VKLRWQNVAPSASFAGELLGFLALFLSPEIERPLLFAPLVAWLLAFGFGFRLKDRMLLPLVAAAGIFSLGSGILGGAGSMISVARVLVGAHALLWCSLRPSGYRYWRLGLAFLEVVLAAILSPETYMLALIFFFAIVGSVALSFGFLERNFREADPEQLGRPVPLHFLGVIISLAVAVFLSSLLIFPILPRSNWAGNQTQTGYTELVSFRSATLGWGDGSAKPVLWIFRTESIPWEAAVPLGLVRGKVLDHFDGVEWRAGVKQFRPDNSAENFAPTDGAVDIFREPMETEVLPVPYGAVSLNVDSAERRRYYSGEWPWRGSQKRRLEYRAQIGKDWGLPRNDPPRPVHLEFPHPEKFPRLETLAREISSTSRNTGEKIKKVYDLLHKLEWRQEPVASALASGPHPVETFLFDSKRGHCELFATAAALLFRKMGLPARLVAGFRARLPEGGSVLTVRGDTGHAWAEVYTRERGWIPFDGTPVLIGQPPWWEKFSGPYEVANAYWHRYILGYEMDPAALRVWRDHAIPYMVPAVGALLAILLGMAGRRLWRWRQRFAGNRNQLIRAYEWADRRGLWDDPEAAPLLEAYEKLRFVREEPSAAQVKSFRRSVKDLNRSFSVAT
jgi:hypothetical protein